MEKPGTSKNDPGPMVKRVPSGNGDGNCAFVVGITRSDKLNMSDTINPVFGLYIIFLLQFG
jgi:hypothetical protein